MCANDLLVELLLHCDCQEDMAYSVHQNIVSRLQSYLTNKCKLCNVPTPVGHMRRLPKVAELKKGLKYRLIRSGLNLTAQLESG